MIHFFTYGTDKEEMQTLLHSTKTNRIDMQLIMHDSWSGYQDKIFGMKTAIQSIPKNDIICFVDAYDVIALAEPDEIIKKFKEYNCDLLLSTELNSYPEGKLERYQKLFDEIGYPKTNFKYVNAGGYIGYQHALMDLFSWKTADEILKDCLHGGDQNYFIEYFLEKAKHKRIELDTKQLIFQSMYKVKYEDFILFGGRIYNQVLFSFPCFVHLNGYNAYAHLIRNKTTGESVDVRKLLLEKIETSWKKKTDLLEYDPPYLHSYGTISQIP
jgi:hypothetical protein